MGIDLEQLSPAPWEVIWRSKEDGPTVRCEREECDIAVIPYYDRESPWCVHDAEFIVLARNAFDVMMRRGWWAVRMAPGWMIPYVQETVESDRFSSWVTNRYFPDPFTALVEADCWYRENVEEALILPMPGVEGAHAGQA